MPISVCIAWRMRALCRATAIVGCLSSSQFFALKWSVRPRVRAFCSFLFRQRFTFISEIEKRKSITDRADSGSRVMGQQIGWVTLVKKRVLTFDAFDMKTATCRSLV